MGGEMMNYRPNDYRRDALVDHLDQPGGQKVNTPEQQQGINQHMQGMFGGDTIRQLQAPPVDSFNPATQGVSNTGVGGPSSVPDAPKPQYGNPQEAFRGVMQNYGYGHDALAKAEKDLLAQGIGIQRDSRGVARGRIKDLSTGQVIDAFDPREARTQTDNWETNPQGSEWGWNVMGHLPDGEWEFGGPSGGGGSAPMPQQGGGMNMGQIDPLLGGDAMAQIQAAIGQFANQRPNFQALLQQLK